MITTMDMNATIDTKALTESHRDCFACGAFNAGGLHLLFETDFNGTVSAVWQPSTGFRSYPDRLHGGVIAILLDSAMVHALFARGVAGVTAELTIRYLRSVGLSDPLQVSGRVESERHGIFTCRADIHQAGIHVVRASAKFMAMIPDTPPHPED